ncbi:HTH-type transcriptional activator RhaR [Paenibacillus allorhizoplanae]|uniref:HTH-type transcriptional activator RhaR n=1 Tax=Paenibacillus allorhizoplanae TaxID=2905648 RepID=A0ABM9CLT5_9BACL|nr:helix-turn-helix domain-containing protein [Paenibacillus allorhizoplanae]CAH1216653.1 HTH-type transcriptional activator RhaR [Paenibacillus allorhizoplanae]
MFNIRARMSTIYSRILLFNILLVIILSLAPQLIYIHYFSTAYNQEINRQSTQDVNKLKYAVDETILDRVIRLVNIYFSDIPSNEVLAYPLTHDISGNGYKIAEVSNFLTDIPYKLNFLQSVEVWYTAGNVYINDKYSSYLDSAGSLKSLDEAWINVLRTMTTPNRWLPPRVTTPSNASVITYLSNIPLIDSLANRQAVVAINIKESAIHNLIQSSPTDGEVLFVVDETGKVLVHSDNQWVGQDFSQKDYITTLLQHPESGTFEASVDGVQSVVSYAKSKYNNWQYVSVISIDTLYQKSKQLKHYLLITTILLLTVSLLFSIYMTHWANKPLRSIIQTIRNLGSSDGQEKHAKNEYAMLHQVIDRVSHTITDLNHQMETNKPIIRDKFIMRLLQGDLDQTDPQVANMEKMLQLHFDREKTACMALKVFGTEGIGLKNEMMIQYSMLQHVEELGDYWLCSTMDNEGHIIVILNYSNALDKEKIHSSIRQQMKGKFVLGFGNEYDHAYTNIAQSYTEACECLNYAFIMPTESCIAYEDLAIAQRKEHGSGLQIIEQLSVAVRNRNQEMVFSILEILRKALVSGRYHIDYCRNTVFDAISIIRTTAISMDIDLERFLGYDIRDYGRKMDNVADLTDWLTGVSVQIMEYHTTNVTDDDPGTALERQILAYIEQNIYNEISLSSLSEGIHMNSSYVSRIYKSVMGSNFSEHLAGIKMKHAESLLRETDLSIKEIAAKLGYTSPRYFANVFKENFGCTPKSYRDSLES